jgi:Tol biopolymer transport system component
MLNRIRPVAATFAALLLPACAAELEQGEAEETLPPALQELATSASCPPVRLLEPGVLSTPRDEGRIVFTPDGATAYFHVLDERNVLTIMESRRTRGGWTAPVVASFSGQYDDLDPFVTADGAKLWFASYRPVDGTPRQDSDLWYVTRARDGWSAPVHVPPPISSPYLELFPSTTDDGTLYFNKNSRAADPLAFDGWDIFSARRAGVGYAWPEALEGGVNTAENWEFNPAPTGDGRLLVFSSIRETGLGGPDLYASVRVSGKWAPAVNLGHCVNTTLGEYHPAWSPARRSLTFVRSSEATLGDFFEVRF